MSDTCGKKLYRQRKVIDRVFFDKKQFLNLYLFRKKRKRATIKFSPNEKMTRGKGFTKTHKNIETTKKGECVKGRERERKDNSNLRRNRKRK